MRIHRALLAAGLALAPAAAGADGLHAERITEERFDALRVGGPDADGGVGDWALGNGTLCAVISDPGHETPLHPRGGLLVDLGHCGREDDQWSTLQPMLNLTRSLSVPVERVRAERDENDARIVTEGGLLGLRERTTYRVDSREPSLLRVVTEITRVEEGDEVFALANIVLHANGQLRPFALNTREPRLSRGFDHPAANPGAPASMLGAIAVQDAHVLVGNDEVGPGIAYGLQLHRARLRTREGYTPVPFLTISGESYTMLGVFTRPYWVGDGDPGLVELAQVPFMDLEIGETLTVERSIRVTRRADVSSVTNHIFEDGPRLEGQVDDPSARIHVFLEPGAPITQARPDAQGRFVLELPPGRYELLAITPDGQRRGLRFRAQAARAPLPSIAFDPPARLRLPRDQTVRLVFRGIEGTPDPVFGDDLLGFRVGDERVRTSQQTRTISLAGSSEDPRELRLPPGRYKVGATRGIEYEAAEVEVTVGPGEIVDLEVPHLRRLFWTEGWIGADLHVHSGESFDSSLPLGRQMVAFAANGGELAVATEHDRVIDPVPTLKRLGLPDRVTALSGVEVTSAYHGGESPFSLGHWNAFPLAFRRTAYRGGAPAAEGLRPRDVAAALRQRETSALLQLNHPRGNDGGFEDQRFLTHLAVSGEPYQPEEPLDAPANRSLIEPDPQHGLRDLDFHVVEVMNGSSIQGYRLVREDWFSWLLQGERRTATANSDSHRLGEIPALPRTYVQVPDDSPLRLDPAAFVESLRAGRAYGTTGPLLEVALSGAGIGETIRGAQGRLSVAVHAAPWVPVSELRVFVNGQLVERRQEIMRGEALEIPLRFQRDSFVVVEVEGPASGLYATLAPGFTPFAFTNPIFVDVDGDGAWTAPGLPRR